MEWLEWLKRIVAIEQHACKCNSLLFYAFALARAYVKPNGHPGRVPYPLYTSLTILNISHLQKKLSSPVLKVVYPGRDWLL